MAQLNFERVDFELTNRLRGALNSNDAERILHDRCINAIKLKNIDKADVFKKIHVYFRSFDCPVRIIQPPQILATLHSPGVLDLITLCINAQMEEDV